MKTDHDIQVIIRLVDMYYRTPYCDPPAHSETATTLRHTTRKERALERVD